MDLEVAEPANKFIEDLYESSESLALRLTNDTDVSVLTAQRFYGRFPVTPVEMALDYWYNDFTSAGWCIRHQGFVLSVSAECSVFECLVKVWFSTSIAKMVVKCEC